MEKTFKLGEYCSGGVIKVLSKKDQILIFSIDSDSKQIISGRNFKYPECLNNYSLSEYLEDLTTYYYSEKIIDYIKENFK